MPDLQKAMETCREALAQPDFAEWHTDLQSDAAWQLARAYLEERDEAEITKEWLNAIGLPVGVKVAYGESSLVVMRNPMSDDQRISWSFTAMSEWWHAQGFAQNRGIIRRMASALGIPLKEQP